MTRIRPKVSVVLNTYNRAALVSTAVASVLSQSGVDFELVVVDDGSTDDTQAVLADISDVRMRCVHHSNRGLSASRNVGAREARGEWLLFLDDDDRLCEDALEALLASTAHPSCRIVIGGVRYVSPDGTSLQDRNPVSLSGALAGTFLISRALFHEAGGYLEGIPCSHQTELFLRVRQVLDDSERGASYLARPVVEVVRRPVSGRPEQSPAKTYFGARWLLARHPDQYADHRERATLETIAAVNGMRIGRKAEARRRFVSAIRHDPLSPKRYVRLAGAVASPIGRRIWLRQWEAAPKAQRPLEGVDSLFMPWRYRENPTASCDDDGRNDSRTGAPFHNLVARLVRAQGLTRVVDLGAPRGTDLEDETLWNGVVSRKPDLVICSHLVERVFEPRRLLSGIRRAISESGAALIVTVDRSRLGAEAALGPPTDPRHIREWSADEFGLLLESCGFEIIRIAHRGSAMGFVVRATPETECGSVVCGARAAPAGSKQFQISEAE
jgi:glycosyltransferase involved in cell wall biosynthesis